MAAVTRNLGFGLTANLTYEPPYLFARRMSTLDHLTKGRAGWNIVTSYLESGARNIDFILRKSLTPRLSDVLLGAIADQRPLAGLHVAVDASGEWIITSQETEEIRSLPEREALLEPLE